ncbi:MAG TPA: YceI family protein [Chryseolinea sp.]
MKKSFVLFILVFFIATIAQGQKPYSVKSYKMTIDGTSSMHDWTSDVTKLTWTGQVVTEGTTVKEIKSVVVNIPVAGIKSTKGKTMDNKTYDAFKSDKNPMIVYKLNSVTASGNNLKANGSLTMAGITKPVGLTASAKVLPNGDVQISGNQKLNMTDFSMSPPTALMGSIKVGAEVIIKYEMTLSASK